MKVSEGFDSHARKAGMAHSVRDSEGLGMQGRLRVQGTEWFPRWWISVSGLVDSLMYPRIDLKHRKKQQFRVRIMSTISLQTIMQMVNVEIRSRVTTLCTVGQAD